MITRFRTRPVTSLASVRNARTRIYAPGADPKFSPASPSKTFRLVPAFPPTDAPKAEARKLWNPSLLDQLQSPPTRYRE